MPIHPGSRYVVLDTLREVEGRRVIRARDRLTGAEVVLKRDARGDVAHEARVLRALPPGVGPEALELFAGPDGALLAMTFLPGEPLHEIAGSGASADAVDWLAGLASALQRAHAAGIVHGDLKPGNVLVRRGDGAARVRLIDFGFATTRFPADAERRSNPLGGTPEYLAPEILRGWEPDGRADQYAFGVLAAKLLADRPAAAENVIERMTAPLPARRFPGMDDAWRALSAALGRPMGSVVRPELAGPLVGRRRALDAACEALAAGDLAVRARPGTGLTRFLRELEEAAVRRGTSIVVLDLGLRDLAPEALAGIAAAASSAGARLVWGVPDLSPDLLWLPPSVANVAREHLARARALELEPLSAERFEDLLFSALPSVPEGLGRALHRRSEGDLRVASRELGEIVERFLPPDAAPPDLDLGAMLAYLDTRPIVELPPRAEAVSVDPTGLAIAGVAGEGTPAGAVREVAREVGHSDAFTRLLETGVVQAGSDERLRFVTRQWARRARAVATEAPQGAAALLHERRRPDPDCAADVESAVRRACMLGKDKLAEELLREALRAASREERAGDVRRLALGEDRVESTDAVADTVRTLAGRAGCSEAESALHVGRAMAESDPVVGREMLQLAAGDSGEAGAKATFALAQLALARGDGDELEARLARLRAEEPVVFPDGTTNTLEAWRALREGRPHDARALARDAQSRLAGTESPMEASCAQVLAATDAPSDPAAAIEALERAIPSCRTQRQRIQVLTNLAALCLKYEPARAVARVDEALELLRLAPREDSEARLRLNRASGLFVLGRVAECRAETERLLTRRVVAAVPSRVVMLRTLLSSCLLAVGRGAEAIAQCIAAVRAAAPGDEMTRGHALSAWIEAVVDLGGLTRIDEMAEWAALDPDALGRRHPLAGRRLASLLAWSEGDLDRASATLLEIEGDVLARAAVADRLGLWTQLARVRLEGRADAAALDDAAVRLRETERAGNEPESSYPRVRAWLLRSRLEEAAGRPDEANRLLDAAVEASRVRGWKRLLAECLRLRAQRAVRSKEGASS